MIDAQGSSEILIYGHLPPTQPELQVQMPSTSAGPSIAPPELPLVARRIVPVPFIPPPVMRLPRPDDPTPRKPPLVIFGKKAGQSQRTSSSKPKGLEVEDSSIKRGRETTKSLLKTGSTKSLGRSASFRVPDDVFGSTPMATSALSAKGKGKGKVEGLSSEQFEILNKAEVKKSAVKFLLKYDIAKDDPDFKEVFGFVYRGASFALRTCMGSEIISTNLIDKCADMHARMYVRGDGSVVK
ncbi:hypothetical protein BDM02DRAFT_3187739 [Thelephora ganbajun]|uniref:Uncharacterized protein n=1 Tax=Thelephora ganbajun TaxID=370292 RepID=A0ACB6ZD83_THEGA|nr:hypothetical protein BDM02DRAFT_3187739 [Thelephora ganbajun]